jgi:hypothetical protein
VTPQGKKVVAVLLLALLALPTGLCSLFFTPMGFASMFGHDSLERSIGMFALMCSAVGWTICGLTIWGATRLTRSANLQNPPGDLPP